MTINWSPTPSEEVVQNVRTLLKTEPGCYSIEDLRRRGRQVTYRRAAPFQERPAADQSHGEGMRQVEDSRIRGLLPWRAQGDERPDHYVLVTWYERYLTVVPVAGNACPELLTR